MENLVEQNNVKINIRYFYYTLAYLIFLILIITLADIGAFPWVFKSVRLIPFGDKICHLILIGLLSYFVNSALYCREIKIKKFRILTGSLLITFPVLLEELSQVFLSSRNADITDALSDLAGIYLFGILARINLKQIQALNHKYY